MLIGLRDGGVAVPVHRHDRLHDRAAARVPRGRPRARARDQGRRGAAARCSSNRTCRNCGSEIETSFLRCPSCMRKLKEPCRSCGKPLDPRWQRVPLLRGRGCRLGAGGAQRAPAPGPARQRPPGRASARHGGAPGPRAHGRTARASTAASSTPAPRRDDRRADRLARGEPRSSQPPPERERSQPHGPHPDPREARCLRAGPDRAR